MSPDNRTRLNQLLEIVSRENKHLLAVRYRLLGDDCEVTARRMRLLVQDDTGIDRLESFGAKFARMQNTMVDKLVPAVLRQSGEHVGAAIDNLERASRIGLVRETELWLEMRQLRNRLVHEYFDRPEDMAPALEKACRCTDRMADDFQAIRAYAVSRLDASAPEKQLRL